MATASEQDAIDKVTRTGQIIVGALITGVVVWLVVASLVEIRPKAAGPARGGAEAGAGAGMGRDWSSSILTYTALAFTAVLLPLSFVVPGLITRQNRQAIAAGKWAPPGRGGPAEQQISSEALKTDAGKLAIVYQVQLIIGAAMDEGVAFFAGIAYLLEKDPIALGLALLLLVGLVVRFPTSRRVALWIDWQQEQLLRERQSAL
jgi:hypothetical protein